MKIVHQPGQGEIVEKKSRFIANVYAVTSEDEVNDYLAKIRKEHYNARHHCYAFAIGEDNEIVRSSDDGEPSGTAGHPMLDVLLGEGLHNALIVVTRYFGGTLLGTGGLVRAYSGAAKAGIQGATIVDRREGIRLVIDMEYGDAGKVQYIQNTMELTQLDIQYTDRVCLTLLVPSEQIDQFESQVTNSLAGRVKMERMGSIHYGIFPDGVRVLS